MGNLYLYKNSSLMTRAITMAKVFFFTFLFLHFFQKKNSPTSVQLCAEQPGLRTDVPTAGGKKKVFGERCNVASPRWGVIHHSLHPERTKTSDE